MFKKTNSWPGSVRLSKSKKENFICRKETRQHKANRYFGYCETAVLGLNGDNVYLAAEFKQKKNSKGRKERILHQMLYFESRQEARDAALLMQCEARNLPVHHLEPGQLTQKRKMDLFSKLGGKGGRANISCPLPVFLPIPKSLQDEKADTLKTYEQEKETFAEKVSDADDNPVILEETAPEIEKTSWLARIRRRVISWAQQIITLCWKPFISDNKTDQTESMKW